MTNSPIIISTKRSSELTKAPTRVLSVDDDSGFLKITKQILEVRDAFQVDTALSADEALNKLKKTTYDAVVSDYQMPGKDGLQFLKELRESGNTIPFIIFTGKGREEIAIQALNLGADQYFNKMGNPETVYGELVHGIRQAVERKRAENIIQQQNEFLKNTIESLTHPFYIINVHDYTIQLANSATGFNDQRKKSTCYELTHKREAPCDDKNVCPLEEVKQTKKPVRVEHIHYDEDGHTKNFEVHGYPILDDNGNVVQMIEYTLDITERKKAENSLRNRLQFESMVSKISANLISAPTSELDKTISEALKIICQFMDAERCSIFLFSDNCTKLTNTHEWCSNPKDSQMSLLQGLPVEVFGYYFKILKKLKTIVVNRPDDLPNEAKNERKWSEEHGFRPLVFIPMIHKGALYGTVGYYGKVDKEQVWSKDAIRYLNILSDIFVNAMEHKRFEEEIKGLARFPSENSNPVLRIDKDGVLLYANASSQPLLEEWNIVQGQLVPDQWSRLVKEVLNLDKKTTYEVKYRNRVFSFEISPIAETNYVNVYGRDITERTKSEEKLKESEEDYRHIVELAPDGIITANRRGVITSVNSAFLKLTDFSEEEIVGKHFTKIGTIKARDLPRYIKLFTSILRGKTTSPIEFEYVKKDGTQRWGEAHSSVLKKDGSMVGFQAILRDITDSKESLAKIQASEERFRRLVELAPDGIVTLDVNGVITSRNTAASRISGYPRGELIGKHFTALGDLPVRDLPKMKELFTSALKGKETAPFEVDLLRKDGTPYVAEVNIGVQKENGKTTGLQVILRDVTERKKTFRKLETVNEKLEVVGGLTRHDINNKLATIRANIYLAKQGLAGDNQALEHLREIESAVGQAEQIFDFARVYEKLGTEELKYIRVVYAVEGARKQFSDLKLKIVNDCGGLRVLSDSMLSRLFYNLIDNSLKHGEKITKIRVYYEEIQDNLHLVYEDDGVGISQSEKEKIFEQGYGKGSGLGLYLIKKMCEVYGWTIKETGKQGEGVRFIMTLPKVNVSEGKPSYIFKK